MGQNDRGFFSIDALFAVTLLLVVSTSFLNMYEGRKQAAEITGARLEAKLVGEKLAAALTTVYANESNFELLLELDDNVGGYGYHVRMDNDTRQISVENSAWGAVSVVVVCNNIEDFLLDSENLGKTVRVYWVENQIRVVNA